MSQPTQHPEASQNVMDSLEQSVMNQPSGRAGRVHTEQGFGVGRWARRYSLQAMLTLFLTFLMVFVQGTAAAAEPVSKSKLNGRAIGGHDSVAYHSLQKMPQAKAVAGKGKYVVKYKGAKWRFASQQSADLFKADPARYSPAYNGHCANALSLGKGLLRTDGTHWEIFGDQLYLFYAARGRDRWLAAGNIEEYKAAADKAWAQLSN